MSGNQQRFQQAMNQGHTAAWDQQWEKAIGYYQQALGEFPEHLKALTSLGLALLELDRYGEALECYRKASTLSPGDPILLEKVAQVCERLGRLNDAIQVSLQAADLRLKNKEVDKAVENWKRVTGYNGDHLIAHSRLAVVYERMGRRAEAVEEYLWVASIVQRTGADDKALQAINYALQIMPENQPARKAMAMLRSNQMLPRPPKGIAGTGPMRPAAEKPASKGEETAQTKELDPVSEARQRAMAQLANHLFEQKEEQARSRPLRKTPGAILRGRAAEGGDGAEQAKLLRFLGQAIEEQSQGMDALAMVDLGNAMEAGLKHPAAYFSIGLLAAGGTEHPESALRDLQTAAKSPDYTLAARIIAGQTLKQLGRMREAAVEYLEALRLADAQTVSPEQAEDIKQLYDPVIATQVGLLKENELEELCRNIAELLSKPGWRDSLARARQQLPQQPEGNPPLLLAEMLFQTRSTQVVESLAAIRGLSDQNLLRTAMEEAFTALEYAPTYLPLHVQIGDILYKEDHHEEAIEKYRVVARAYSVRGEAGQAVSMLRRLLKLDPSNLSLKGQLIEQLIAAGQTAEAVRNYLELADIYYRQMDLDETRATYVTALKLVQGTGANRDWIVEILNRMADLDLQRLDLRQALRIYEQVRTLRPEDPKARMNIIAVDYRTGQEAAARAEMENYLSALEKSGKGYARVGFLKNLVEEHPELADLARSAGYEN